MPITNHDLVNEFPEFREKIHQLKLSDSHFYKLLKSYDKIEHEVQHIEKAGQNTSDGYLETLRKKRLKLKDELYAMLRKAA